MSLFKSAQTYTKDTGGFSGNSTYRDTQSYLFIYLLIYLFTEFHSTITAYVILLEFLAMSRDCYCVLKL